MQAMNGQSTGAAERKLGEQEQRRAQTLDAAGEPGQALHTKGHHQPRVGQRRHRRRRPGAAARQEPVATGKVARSSNDHDVADALVADMSEQKQMSDAVAQCSKLPIDELSFLRRYAPSETKGTCWCSFRERATVARARIAGLTVSGNVKHGTGIHRGAARPRSPAGCFQHGGGFAALRSSSKWTLGKRSRCLRHTEAYCRALRRVFILSDCFVIVVARMMRETGPRSYRSRRRHASRDILEHSHAANPPANDPCIESRQSTKLG
jgi:hypothetical protein